jgi:hypothetical protein
MTAIIWKELREHLKWAVLWMVALGIALAFMLYVARQQSLCSGPFLGVLAFGGSLGGALLALVQILPETRRGQWAFLVHRPASRTSLFLGKVVGGLLLYFAATGVPFLVATLWAATPGILGAPFDVRMVLPGIANILAGTLVYFAGLLTALRPVRWYGSRALPLVTAIPCVMAVTAVPEFWMALLVIAVGAVVLGLAAWGSFQTAGAFGAQPRPAKVALAITIAGGIAVVGALLILIAGEFSFRPDNAWTYYGIDASGNMLAITHEYGAVVKVVTPDGTEPEEYRDAKGRSGVSRRLLYAAHLLNPVWGLRPRNYEDVDRYFFPIHQPGDIAWYYVSSRWQLEGYSKKDRRYVGSIGPAGFSPAGSPPGSAFTDRVLRNPWSDTGLLTFADAVYRVDTLAQRVHKLLTAPPGQEIVSAVRFACGLDGQSRHILVAATRQELLFFEPDGTLLFNFKHAYDLAQYNQVQVSGTAGGERLFVWYSTALRTLSEHVIELDADGHETGRYELPSLASPHRGPRWIETLLLAGIPWPAVAGPVVFDRLTGSAGGSLATAGFLMGGSDTEYLPASVTTVLLALPFAALSAAISYCVGRRYAVSRSAYIGWTVSGFFLGPIAVLTLIALRDWPAREPCSACGKMRVVDRDLCEHCGAPFPTPVPDGTEIFEAPAV